MTEEFINSIEKLFPVFAQKLRAHENPYIEQVQPGATADEIADIETEIELPLPQRYKDLLGCAREFDLLGGVIQFGFAHPFVHDFEPFEALTPAQQQAVRRKGDWPPPSNGMLCFAEFFMEADGDQVLFDVSNGLVDGEYPVMYYAHEVPEVRKLADDFETFLNDFLDYEEWG